MSANQAIHSVRTICRVLLKISKSGFYAWNRRPLPARRRVDLGLLVQIQAAHRRSRGTYGAPRIHAELADEHGTRIGRKRVAQLMREAELRGISPRRWVRTTASDPAGTMVTDLVNRQFKASAPDRLWVADITYGTVSEVIPVNLVIRGCPPTPVDMLRGLTWLLSRP